MADDNHDVFEDESTEAADVAEVTADDEADDTADEADEGSDQEGDDDAAETPDAEDDDGSGKSEKMIPEHRFKAALKDVNDKLTEANAKLAKQNPVTPPDRASDPDGYDRHVRIETSKILMRETHDDYDEMIAHYQEMAKENPFLNNAVADHPTPAKHAYDLAKKDLEVKDALQLKGSDEYKEFLAWKKANKTATNAEVDAAATAISSGKKAAASKVPNLNRGTSVTRAKPSHAKDDGLFKGHYSTT